MSTKKFKYDVFEVLTKISTKDREYFENLSEEQWKHIQPLVLLKWMLGTPDPAQLYLLNQFVNPHVFEMYRHPKMLVYGMMACAPGRFTKYRWFKSAGKGNSSMPTCNKLLQEVYHYNESKAGDALPLLSDEDILQLADEAGRQPDEIKLIKKELKIRA